MNRVYMFVFVVVLVLILIIMLLVIDRYSVYGKAVQFKDMLYEHTSRRNNEQRLTRLLLNQDTVRAWKLQDNQCVTVYDRYDRLPSSWYGDPRDCHNIALMNRLTE